MSTLAAGLLVAAVTAIWSWIVLIGPVGYRLCRYGHGRHTAARPLRVTAAIRRRLPAPPRNPR